MRRGLRALAREGTIGILTSEYFTVRLNILAICSKFEDIRSGAGPSAAIIQPSIFQHVSYENNRAPLPDRSGDPSIPLHLGSGFEFCEDHTYCRFREAPLEIKLSSPVPSTTRSCHTLDHETHASPILLSGTAWTIGIEV